MNDLVANEYRMGDYIKIKDQTVLESEVVDISFDKEFYSREDVDKCLEKMELIPMLISDVANNEKNYVNVVVHDRLSETLKTVELDKGIIATCNVIDSKSKKQLMDSKRKKDCEMKHLYKKLLDRPSIVKFHTPIELTEKAADDFIIEGFASTGTVDRDQDIVEPSAFRDSLDMYMKNPILCYMHDWASPIGKVIDARIVEPEQRMLVNGKNVDNKDGGLYIRATISKSVPEIRQLIKEGVLKAFSIGFMIKDAMFDEVEERRRIKDIELYEISVVSIPSNRESLFSMSKALKSGSDIKMLNDMNEYEKPILDVKSEKLRSKFSLAVKSGKLNFSDLETEKFIEQYKSFGKIRDVRSIEKLKDMLENKGKIIALMGATDTMEGELEDQESHKHSIQIAIEKDDEGNIIKFEGIASEGSDHQHPIKEPGRTETIDNHYHTFNVDKMDIVATVDTANDEVSDDDKSGKKDALQEDKEQIKEEDIEEVAPDDDTNEEVESETEVVEEEKKDKVYTIPQDIMNDILECLIADDVDNQKYAIILEYLANLVSGDSEKANTKYILEQCKLLISKAGGIEDDRQKSLEEAITKALKN